LFDHMHLLGYEEVERICAWRRIPPFIAKRLDPQHKAWINSKKNNADVKRIGKAPIHSARMCKGLNVLQDAPPSQLGFITVVTEFAGSEADAIRQAVTSAFNLSSFIRRRFDHAVCVLCPEVDQKVAKIVDAGIGSSCCIGMAKAFVSITRCWNVAVSRGQARKTGLCG
jgi:hypothetical protein